MVIDHRADILFTDGHVWTGLERRAPVDSVAVLAGHIVGVGSRADLGWALGSRTRVISLRGRLLLPAFHDAHVHPILAGLAMDGCQLAGLPDQHAYLEAVAAYAAEHPERPWIRGEGWSMSAFPGGIARASQLDELVSDRPVYLESRDGHSAWVNSAALAAARITAETPDPPHGRIERHGDGSPRGMLHQRATELVASRAPAATAAELEAALLRAQSELQRRGIGAWQDAHVTPEQQAAYLALVGRGQLSSRVALSLRWDASRDLRQVPELVARREAVAEAGAGRVRAVSVKLFQDGVIETATAALLEPYLEARDRPSANRGESLFAPEELRDICIALDRERFAAHVHAVGDRAVREVLDALTAARKVNGPREARHQIAHLQLVHPSDLSRFAALGAVANCQPLWAAETDEDRLLVRPALGPERMARSYPFGSLQRTGTSLAIGSDWNVSAPDPMAILDAAIRRVDAGRPGARPLGPVSERITPEAALRAYTRGSAYAGWMDDVSGSIEVGKSADLVVLDGDPLRPEGPSFTDARVLLTLLDGRVAWQSSELGG